ncbi:hypothetical protein TraAM80_08354 [Trypanosoma rangeli]|uniref:Uncharacterized protein n=1 Tax=Trypanosoma rangeli TaxID=5698 RepID=A0A422N134_TRYRA|nr:uncharacterized protein TraAM80_08354 [Trypanosoma rangeli]RNE99149.1 hypothetical protein TraAM80_08354 [Trypanosoma rangeli]|eukprot:RNE99149.1 hypothetical protein TraAM80_08354 [Trypanosoma rangeli]
MTPPSLRLSFAMVVLLRWLLGGLEHVLIVLLPVLKLRHLQAWRLHMHSGGGEVVPGEVTARLPRCRLFRFTAVDVNPALPASAPRSPPRQSCDRTCCQRDSVVGKTACGSLSFPLSFSKLRSNFPLGVRAGFGLIVGGHRRTWVRRIPPAARQHTGHRGTAQPATHLQRRPRAPPLQPPQRLSSVRHNQPSTLCDM